MQRSILNSVRKYFRVFTSLSVQLATYFRRRWVHIGLIWSYLGRGSLSTGNKTIANNWWWWLTFSASFSNKFPNLPMDQSLLLMCKNRIWYYVSQLSPGLCINGRKMIIYLLQIPTLPTTTGVKFYYLYLQF